MSDDLSLVSKESWENDCSEDETELIETARPWSDGLISLEKPGLGLQLACDKAKELTLCSRRAVLLLLETNKLYDGYGRTLAKAAQNLQTITGDSKAIRGMQELIVSFSNTHFSQLSKVVRSSYIIPMHSFLSTHDEAITCLLERYQASRQTETKVRRNALAAREAYIANFKEAAAALTEWKKEISDENKDMSGAQMPRHILAKLSNLRAKEAKYKRFVSWQNECTQQCHRLEVMALESTQRLYEDRFVIFVHSMIKVMKASANPIVDANGKPTSPAKKRSPPVPKNSLSGMILTVEDEEESGAMDAETLGLDEYIGELRDKVRGQAAARARVVQTARLISRFLDSLAAASKKLGDGLNQQLFRPESSGHDTNHYDSIHKAMSLANEGPRSLHLWNVLSRSLHSEAKQALSFAAKIHAIRSDKLDHITEYGEKVLKPAAERDNATWKQLCDAARSQSKAETRYRDVTAQSAKVRDRCKSVDSDSTAGTSLMAGANKHVTQSLASMFQSFPNGGEHVMKVLDASTRASVAQLSIDEADQKESKGRNLLDSSRKLTLLSLEAYKSSAETVLKECETSIPQDYVSIMESLSLALSSFREVRQVSLNDEQAAVAHRAWVDVDGPLNAWLLQNQQQQRNYQGSFGVSNSVELPLLTVQLEQSVVVRRAFSFLAEDDDGDDAPLEIDDADVDAEPEGPDTEHVSSATPLRERATSAASVSSHKSQTDETPAGWLLRSLTMPDSESIFGRMVTKKVSRMRQPTFASADTETSVFAQYFWREDVDENSIPTIDSSFSCSFREGGQRFPFQYGRVFLSEKRLTFVAWTRKRLCLKWSEVVDVELAKKRIAQEDCFIIKCKRSSASEESFMILAGVNDCQAAFETLERIRSEAAASSLPTLPVDTEVLCRLPAVTANAVPPDQTLERMDRILSGTVRNISIQRFYNLIWAEGTGTDEKPFYRPWVEEESFDVEMPDWEFMEVKGPWCGDTYTQKRVIKFKTKRTTHLYIGPPIANVTQTHYCRVDGNDLCILQMTVELEGIPYADTFAVEIRWVARREGAHVKVDVGVEVDFKKSTFLRAKIRSGTIEETSPIHKRLFDAVKAACSAANGDEAKSEDGELKTEGRKELIEIDLSKAQGGSFFDAVTFDRYIIATCSLLLLLIYLRRRLSLGSKNEYDDQSHPTVAFTEELVALNSKIDSIEIEMKAVKDTLAEILALLKQEL